MYKSKNVINRKCIYILLLLYENMFCISLFLLILKKYLLTEIALVQVITGTSNGQCIAFKEDNFG